MNAKKIKRRKESVLYTVCAVLLLIAIILAMVIYIFGVSEAEAYEKLHLQTQQIKKDINLQMFSDCENLMTMANFAAELHEEGEDFSIILNSFKEIGLFENIGILLPDNNFITKAGTMTLEGKVDFFEEVEKGDYISGRVEDFTYEKRQVVRCAVPIKIENGDAVGILYGVINLDKFEERYVDDAKAINASLYVIEGGNGNFIIDTKHKNFGNISELAVSKFNYGYSYNDLIEHLTNGKNGYSSFMAINGKGYLYAHYAPLKFSNWQVMLMQPESVVFAGARSTLKYLLFFVLLIFLVVALYVTMIFASERKKLKISKNASNIRKNLLGSKYKVDRIYVALESITNFVKGSASFVVDSKGGKYSYNVAGAKQNIIDDEKFTSLLWEYNSKNHDYRFGDLYIAHIAADKKLKNSMPEFYEFLKNHKITSIHFACIFGNDANTSLLGVIDARDNSVAELLTDIAVCFTMAIHNQKHLVKTETMALVDALTGVANRMAYNEDIKKFSDDYVKELTCVYVDVNELNFYNNNYGHAAGDQMLRYIAEVIKEEFAKQRVYRMGGDEFLIFTEGLSGEEVTLKLKAVNEKIEDMKYHVSLGIKCGEAGMTLEELVVSAEKLMYEEKARYYQNKEKEKMAKLTRNEMEIELTGIEEIDACLSTMSMRYRGVFCLSHRDDCVRTLMSPTYFQNLVNETNSFSEAMKTYMHEYIKPEYHRILLGFLEYDALENNIKSGNIPRITYTRIDGEKVVLSIYPNKKQDGGKIDTIWIFEQNE